MSLYYLDILQGTVRSCKADGSDERVIVDNIKTLPDGIQVDDRPGQGWIYWTNMGTSPDTPDGSLSRCRLDGSQHEYIVQPGATITPKQMQLDVDFGFLYWCDREGKAIFRAKLDGSDQTRLYQATVSTEPESCAWCVGVAIDKANNYIYWTQKGPSKGGLGRIFRAPLDRAAQSQDSLQAQVVFEHLPEPIDLEIDEDGKHLYWTDRGDVPFGNTLNRWSIQAQATTTALAGQAIIATKLHEGIGLALDQKSKHVYVSDLLGGLYRYDWDGGNKKVIFQDAGNLTGIAFVEPGA